MKKIIVILFISIAFLIFQAPTSHSNSSEPPIYNAGAPGQSSCNGGSCHVTNEVDSGDGGATILLNNGEINYLPETVYNLSLEINHLGSKRFGFQMVAFDDDNNSVGTFFVNEMERVGVQVFDGIQFVNHKIAPTAADSYTFKIEWESPMEVVGDIHFYASANAANGSGSTDDFIYTTQLDISPKDETAIVDIYQNEIIKIYPNPTSDFVFIENDSEKIEQVSLYTASGKMLLQNTNSKRVDLRAFDNGIYFLKVILKNKTIVRQVLKY